MVVVGGRGGPVDPGTPAAKPTAGIGGRGAAQPAWNVGIKGGTPELEPANDRK